MTRPPATRIRFASQPSAKRDPGAARGLGRRGRRAHRVERDAALDDEAAGEVVGEPRILAEVDLLPAHRLGVGPRVRELGLLDGEEEHRPLAQVERHRPLLLELAVPGDRLVEQLADPGGRLAEEEAAVPPGGAGADPAAVDDEHALAPLGEQARRRAAGDAGSDDDGVRRV